MEKYVGNFVAVDANGTKYEIHIYQRFLQQTTFDGTSVVPGVKRLVLPNGTPVNRVGERQYEILAFGGNIPATSDDPDAP